MNLSIGGYTTVHINFQGIGKVNSPFFHTESPDFVNFFTRLSYLQGKSQCKMYGIAIVPSCVDVLVCCSFYNATSKNK